MIDYQTNISTSSHRNLNRMIGDKSKKSATEVNWNKFNSNYPSNNQINVNKRPQSSFSQRGPQEAVIIQHKLRLLRDRARHTISGVQTGIYPS